MQLDVSSYTLIDEEKLSVSQTSIETLQFPGSHQIHTEHTDTILPIAF